MKDITIIEERQVLGKEFRIYGTVENPLFLAKDVASWIEHSNARMMLKSVDEDEKVCVNNPYASQGQQEQWFVTEDGLYEVLMQSRKPIAKQFKKEVKKILKQIRQTGGYIPVKENESNEEFLARALLVAQETLNKKNLLLKQTKQQVQDKQVVIDTVINDKCLFAIGSVGKILKPYCSEMGAVKIFKFLRQNEILMDAEGTQRHNLPYDRYNKYFEMKYVESYFGTHTKTYFNGKGVKWFLNKLVREGYLTKEDKVEVEKQL